MVCPMRFFLVAASAAVALLSALASLLGWTRTKSGYESESEEDDDDSETVAGDAATSTSTTLSPSARRQREPRRGKHNRSARELAGLGLSALWDAFTGRYLARTTRDMWRAASRSASPQPQQQEKRKRRRSMSGNSRKSE